MHSPEHVCEALEWLYGGEWHSHGHGNYSGGNLCVSESNGGKWCVERYVGRRDDVLDCTDRVALALAVTAPWEWTRRELAGAFEFSKKDVYATASDGNWSVSVTGTTMLYEAASLEAAKTAARTAYLTWMRGRLALWGLEK